MTAAARSRGLALAVSVLIAASAAQGQAPIAAGTAGYDAQGAADRQASALLAADEEAWRAASRISWGPAAYRTEFQALWSDAGLFLRFEALDRDPWSIATQRDAPLWREEAVEIFIAPGTRDDPYYELQISPANVVADLRVDLRHRRFDPSWNLRGLRTQVHARRDPAGRATGWTAIALLPWSGFDARRPPRPGERWRFNVFRIERPGGRDQPEIGALLLAWSPTGQRSFHVPDAFADLRFR